MNEPKKFTLENYSIIIVEMYLKSLLIFKSLKIKARNFLTVTSFIVDLVN